MRSFGDRSRPGHERPWSGRRVPVTSPAGWCSAYDNVRVEGHVERRINQQEAPVVRRLFELCAQGNGLKGITKILNAELALAPRSQRGRPRGWAPSTVRDILYRDIYRGLLVWNKTRKRDADGQKHQTDRPATEWMRREATELRIVSDTVWQAAHRRLTERRTNYRAWNGSAARGKPEARGGRRSYLLSGFARCAGCGGSIQAVSRESTKNGRNFRYICSTYWNRGASVCGNGRMVTMEMADAGIRELLRKKCSAGGARARAGPSRRRAPE